MNDLFNDGDAFSLVRSKINTVNGLFQIAQTDGVVTAGTITSIPVDALPATTVTSGQKVTIIDSVTGLATEVTLSAQMTASATSISINSTVFAGDISDNSAIYFKYADLLALYFA